MTSSTVDPAFAYVILRFGSPTTLDPSFVPVDYLNEKARAVFELSQHVCLPEIEQRIVADGITAHDSFTRAWPKPLVDEFTRQAAYPTLKTDIPIFMGMGGKTSMSIPPTR